MNLKTFYHYLTLFRRDLWAFLENLPDDVLSKNMIPAERFHSIKDLLMHIAAVEDSWIHEDILRDTPVWQSALPETLQQDGAFFADTPLETILLYSKAVEQSTLAFLEGLQPSELERIVEEERSVEGLGS